MASLNRKHEVFGACCDAIESLGYRKLASLLRDSLAAISVYETDKYPDYYAVWVKKAFWSPSWSNEVYNILGTQSKVKEVRGVLVPKTQKRALWAALNKLYTGYVVKTSKGAFKIGHGARKPAVSTVV